MTRKKVYFFDEWNSSRWNGIGSYRDILLPLLADISESLTLVSLNSDMDSPKVIYRKVYDEISIPLRWCGAWRRNGASVAAILSQEIVDSADNVFMINHSPCAEFITELRKKFPLSKYVFTVHDLGWCSALMGDSTLLEEIMVHDKLPSIVSDRTARMVRESCAREKEIFHLVDAVVCLSPSTARILRSVYGIPKEKIFMIPNAFRAEMHFPGKNELRRQLGVRPDEKIIIYVGRPERHKGFDAVLHLAEALKGHPLNFRILLPVAFNTLSPRYKQMISEIAPMLILPGFLPKDRLYRWYAAADIGLLCSYAEQCSMAALEMMAFCDIIVSSKVIGLTDMFDHGKDAFCVDASPVNDDTVYVRRLKDTIIEAASAPLERLEAMASLRAKKLQNNFSPARMRQSYENMMLTL